MSGTPASERKPAPMRRDWLAKTSAGALLGFSLALLCSALLDWACAALPPGTRAQFAMWVVTPVWLGVLSSCFLFRSGARAWLFLGGANLLALGALSLTRLS
jgi:hypothetical protein